MLIEVTNTLNEIDFAPENETLEIIQNVRMILSTMKNSVPLFREFGISVENLDAPINIATAKITAELAKEIAQFEPRCQLKSCKISGNATEGELQITATIEI